MRSRGAVWLRRAVWLGLGLSLGLGLGLGLGSGGGARAQETVRFPSLAADGAELVGFVFVPGSGAAGPYPALVLLHGRAGVYSSAAKGTFTAATLSQRHRLWAQHWADRGYVAILPDSFGPRGHPEGFPRNSYGSRPEYLDETVVRPLDAYGALAHLRQRPDVDAARIAVMGWSNGGSAALAASALAPPAGLPAFRAALALYPACGLKDRFRSGLPARMPVLMLLAGDDDEVSPELCRTLAMRSRQAGAAVDFQIYPGAVHGFDDPGARRQSLAANRSATEDAFRRADDFFAAALGR